MSKLETCGGYRQQDAPPSPKQPPPMPSDATTSARPRKVLVLLSLLLSLIVAGCGSTAPSPRPVPQPAATPPVGLGCMGPCRPRATPNVGATRHVVGHARIPDVSEYQPCVTARVPTVIRLYEAGTGLQDRMAACNARRLRSWRVWFAGYSFLRPGSCVAQADRTAAVVRGIGGLDGPVIADAEVPLPRGFVGCFLEHVHRELPRTPTATYTSCGTASEVVLPLWVANYGVQWPCSPFGDPFDAWQFSEGVWCGESFITDCSFDFGITRLRPVPPGPSPAEKRRLVRYWTAERHRVLHRYHLDGCRGNSTGPKCTALRNREHVLYLDIRRLAA